MMCGSADILIYVSPFDGDAAASHRLLQKAAALYSGENFEAQCLSFGEKGKPFFQAAPQIHFSITHSGAYWMCAFSTREVGLDLQAEQPCQRDALSKRFFHPDEDQFLRRHAYADFFDLWSAKESYLKYTGQGITDELGAISVVAQGSFPAVAGAWLKLLPWKAGYSLCLCAREAGTWKLLNL